MIIIRIKGGLGNQMFQYALGKKLAHELHTQLVMDLSSLLDRSKGDFVYRDYDLSIFKVEEHFLTPPWILRTLYKPGASFVTRWIRRNLNKGRLYLKEKHFHYEPAILEEAGDNCIYEGWFQSPRYFAGVEEALRKDFSFKTPILAASRDLAQRIATTNAVCLNVRRTDFLKVKNLNTTSKAYFLRAAEYLADKVDHPVFFVFSDDVAWCRKHIVLDHPVEVVGHEHKGKKFGNYMQLMSACKHFIIPNSSFAWWAVWLNRYPDKIVVAPKNWFNDPGIDTSDLVPEHWVRL